MSEPTAEPSLIQQRMVLQRRRSWAIYTIAFSALMLTGSTVVLVFDGGVLRLIGVALFLIGIGVGIVEYRRAVVAIREFEDRHGPGAGIQH
ncbi:hypothetical protein RN51_01762 [Microbacterium oxydans]|uniref:DUF202 domain-containing protein n=1 Tax=Microbacterium oxydans TaxID=82380 RepID=A0A0F0KNI9_9MICO|nr:hypothetical protein [Microbacterium oxydans]KJL22448.1 hypothetical protein RN51_01762 [Microbacterium oxydans]